MVISPETLLKRPLNKDSKKLTGFTQKQNSPGFRAADFPRPKGTKPKGFPHGKWKPPHCW